MDDDLSFEEDFSEITFNECIDDVAPPKHEPKKEDNPFEILSMENILTDVFDRVNQVRSFLDLPGFSNSAIRALLTYYKWDCQRLIGEYYEYIESDPNQFFKQAEVANPFDILPMTNGESDSDVCKLCCDTSDSFYSLRCGHKSCTGCWNQYLTMKIADEGLNQSITCFENECKTLVDDEDVIVLVENPEVISKYQRSMTNSFIQNNKAMRWCPSATGCSFAAKKMRTAKCPCACKCGHEFCFDCSAEFWHEPVTCDQLKQWKNNSDSETYQWIAEHAKPCPNCEANIEKNGGCNHMTCRHCRHEFCWVCMGNWRGHNACNRFDETKVFAQREVARFKHFQDRYGNQLESLRLEGIQHRDIDKKVNELKDMFSFTNNQIQFLRDAVRVLHVSRRTLTYTFVFAYFLRKNNHVEIFEDNQSDLESAVERLSGYLEQEMTADNVVELKKNIQDSFKYCEKRCNVLMEHIREAGENHLWEMC